MLVTGVEDRPRHSSAPRFAAPLAMHHTPQTCDGAGTAPRPPTLGPRTHGGVQPNASTHAAHAGGTPLI